MRSPTWLFIRAIRAIRGEKAFRQITCVFHLRALRVSVVNQTLMPNRFLNWKKSLLLMAPLVPMTPSLK